MPIFDTLHLEGTSIYLWKLDESLDELVKLCRDQSIEPDNAAMAYKSISRKKEKLTEQLLLREIFHAPVRLEHDANGAPLINIPGISISISHTAGWLCMAFTNSSCYMGIDIEAFNKRVLNVRQKFLNDDEQAWIPSDDITANLLAWTAKEAIYKANMMPGTSLARGINLERFSGSSVMPMKYKGYVIALTRTFSITSECRNNFILSLAIRE